MLSPILSCPTFFLNILELSVSDIAPSAPSETAPLKTAPGESSARPESAADVEQTRHDWTMAEIRDIYQAPIPDLIHRAHNQ